MLDVRISQQFASIGLKISPAQYTLKQTKPELEVKQLPAQLDLAYTPPEVRIDYTAVREALGLGNINFVAKSFADAAKEDLLTDIEKRINIDEQIAFSLRKGKERTLGQIIFDSVQPSQRELVLIPLPPIDITYIPAQVKPEVRLGGVEIWAPFSQVKVEDFVFPSVDVYLEKEPYLKIETVGQIFDQRK